MVLSNKCDVQGILKACLLNFFVHFLIPKTIYPVESVGKEVIFSGRIEYFSQTDWIKLHFFTVYRTIYEINTQNIIFKIKIKIKISKLKISFYIKQRRKVKTESLNCLKKE
jgi:hypothetical protein